MGTGRGRPGRGGVSGSARGWGGTAVGAVTRDDGLLALDVLRPAAARSLFEKDGRFLAWRNSGDHGLVLKPVNCPQETAEALLQSEEALARRWRREGDPEGSPDRWLETVGSRRP